MWKEIFILHDFYLNRHLMTETNIKEGLGYIIKYIIFK